MKLWKRLKYVLCINTRNRLIVRADIWHFSDYLCQCYHITHYIHVSTLTAVLDQKYLAGLFGKIG